MTIRFTKMQACGNDFIVIDDAHARLHAVQSELARRVCHRRFGLGADGLLLLGAETGPSRFGMSFVNADGLVGEMCGNGARCLSAFVHRAGRADGALTLETLAGPIRADLSALPVIALTLGPVQRGRCDVPIGADGRRHLFDEVDAGPPHVVCRLDTIEALEGLDVVAIGRTVRRHAEFAPRGCNVNFIALAPDGTIHLRTYERGVEDETPGCGTGAVAAACVVHAGGGSPRFSVLTRSGETLLVDLTEARAPRLVGGAHFVAEGVLDASLLAGLDLAPDAGPAT